MKTAEEWMIAHMKLLGMTDEEIEEQISRDEDGHCTLIKQLFSDIQQDARQSAAREAAKVASKRGISARETYGISEQAGCDMASHAILAHFNITDTKGAK